jgi:hypothetical protein
MVPAAQQAWRLGLYGGDLYWVELGPYAASITTMPQGSIKRLSPDSGQSPTTILDDLPMDDPTFGVDASGIYLELPDTTLYGTL